MKNKIKISTITLLTLIITITAFSQQLKVGDTIPDFALKNLNGDSVSISDFRGQIVMLTFFATCAPLVW